MVGTARFLAPWASQSDALACMTEYARARPTTLSTNSAVETPQQGCQRREGGHGYRKESRNVKTNVPKHLTKLVPKVFIQPLGN